MPTYEYTCTTCGARFDWLQSIKAEPLTTCPAEVCRAETKGAGTVARRISRNTGLIFKGDGFYLTDYARKGGGSNSSSSEAPSAPAAAADVTKE